MFIARRRFRPYQGSVPATVLSRWVRFFLGVPGSHFSANKATN